MQESPPTSFPPPAQDLVDPELVALPRKRSRVGPVLVASVLVLSAYLALSLRADLAYWLRSRKPNSGTGRVAQSLADNSYVTLDDVLGDCRAPLRLRGRHGTWFRLLPVVGASGSLWLHLPGEPQVVPAVYHGTYAGRLRRLERLDFADELRSYHERSAPVPVFIAPATLLSPSQPPASSTAGVVVDTAGVSWTVTPDTRVRIDEIVQGTLLVTVVKSERMVDANAAASALVAAGAAGAAPAPTPTLTLTPALTPAPSSEIAESWTFELATVDSVATMRARLSAAKLFGTAVKPKIVVNEGTWAEVSVAAPSQTIAFRGRPIPVATVEHLVVWAKSSLPNRVSVLFVDQTPGQYWYVPVLFLALGCSCLLLVWALWRSMRKEDGTDPIQTRSDQ
ncbi:MAG: hypothetical protein V2A73_12950 [Pseudomonadota bacterium]